MYSNVINANWKITTCHYILSKFVPIYLLAHGIYRYSIFSTFPSENILKFGRFIWSSRVNTEELNPRRILFYALVLMLEHPFLEHAQKSMF